MNNWQPISLSELDSLLTLQLKKCSTEQQSFFAKYRVEPYRLPIHRLGALEEVFVVAELPKVIIYYEDVEEGFEIGEVGSDGAIPVQGCNQFELTHVLAQLLSNQG